MMNDNEDINETLEYNDIDLKDEVDSEETETLPPEENSNGEEKELNVGNIIAIALIVIIVIIFIFVLSSGKKKKKADENSELDKSGSKTEINFRIEEKQPPKEISNLLEEENDTETEKNVDDILNSLPPELQLNPQPPAGQAPVAPIGSSTVSNNYISDRPDTKNSKSARKIEGIKGQNYTSNSNSMIADVFNGRQINPSQPYQSLPADKNDYIAQQMEAIQKLQSNYYNNQNGTDFYSNRESFFQRQANQGGTGNYMPYNSLWDGTIIPAALITAINTDNPGIVIARVTENVWSSYDQSLLLIPSGSILFATYNSSINYGQNRVQVAWELLIRPDGYRIQLGNMNGVDLRGMSGYKGFVNNHPFDTLKALGLVAVFSVIQTEITGSINSANNEYTQNAMNSVYAEASKMGNKILDKALDIQPTITIKEGTEIKIITNMPLELPPVEIPQVTEKYVRHK